MRRKMWGLAVFSAACLLGCAGNRCVVLYHVTPPPAPIIEQKTLDRLLWEHELPPDQDLSSQLILTSDFASYHLVQVRGAEKPHLHEAHDLAVFVQSGSGTMFLGKGSFPARPGAVIFVPHGTPHYFYNTGPSPAVAIAVFSPPFDGKDNVPAEPEKKR